MLPKTTISRRHQQKYHGISSIMMLITMVSIVSFGLLAGRGGGNDLVLQAEARDMQEDLLMSSLQNETSTIINTNFNNWKAIWARKGKADILGKKKLALPDLMAANGFEANAGILSLFNVVAGLLVDRVKKRLHSNANKHHGTPLSVLDVGCGAGAVGAVLMDREPSMFARARYVGIDYSPSLLQVADTYFSQQQQHHSPNNSSNNSTMLPLFLTGSAFDLQDLFVPNSFHLVFCNSIMQYFRGMDDAEQMLKGMLHAVRPDGLIVIADIQDKALEQEALQKREKSGYVAKQSHTGAVKGEVRRAFFFAQELKETAKRLGAKTVEIVRTERDLGLLPEEYVNAPFSFNLIITPGGANSSN